MNSWKLIEVCDLALHSDIGMSSIKRSANATSPVAYGQSPVEAVPLLRRLGSALNSPTFRASKRSKSLEEVESAMGLVLHLAGQRSRKAHKENLNAFLQEIMPRFRGQVNLSVWHTPKGSLEQHATHWPNVNTLTNPRWRRPQKRLLLARIGKPRPSEGSDLPPSSSEVALRPTTSV